MTNQGSTKPMETLLDNHLQGGDAAPTTPAVMTSTDESDSESADVAANSTESVATADDTAPASANAVQVATTPVQQEETLQAGETTEPASVTSVATEENTSAVEPTAGNESGSTAPSAAAVTTTEPAPMQYVPSYAYPNPWNPDYYPPFNVMNQIAPVNPYNYPPMTMAPGGMVPPPYYAYPAAPYQYPQPAAAE